MTGAQAWDASLLRQAFQRRVAGMAHPFRSSEEGTGTIFDDLAELPAEAAFALVPTAVEIALERRKDPTYAHAIVLLATLVRSTDTTELPEPLEQHLELLDVAARQLGDNWVEISWHSVREWYRRPA
jgi:hypothetical protein